MIDITTLDNGALENFIKAAAAEKERRAQCARKEAISKLIEAAKKVYEIDHLFSIACDTDEGYLNIYMDDLLVALRESL